MNNVDLRYQELLKDITDNGVNKMDRTGTGTRSVFGRMVKFDMREGFPLITTKKIHTKSVIHELLWFLNGDTNTKYLNDNGVTIWDEWKDEDGNLGPIYGKQWVDWGGYDTHDDIPQGNTIVKTNHRHVGGINQIQYVIDRLSKYPDCRRIMVSAWNVGELDQMKLMPCHYGFQFWTRELTLDEIIRYYYTNVNTAVICKKVKSKYFYYSDEHAIWVQHSTSDIEFGIKPKCPSRGISMSWNQRSCDVGLGIPFNIASYGLLLHMVGQQVNMVPLELTGMLGDCHIYKNHMEQVEEQLSRDPNKYPSPKICLNPEVKSIFDYKYDDIKILDYKSYPTIKMPIAI